MDSSSSQKTVRFHFLDNIRMLCILLVFCFHCSLIFDTTNWHIKNQTLLSFSSADLMMVTNAIMPLLFLISGGSIWFSLQKRLPLTFLKNVCKRCIIPLILGCTVLAIPQIYLERISTEKFEGSLIDFIPHYFNGLYYLGGNFAWTGLHFWYLLLLFAFTILLFPFFYFLKKGIVKLNLQKVISNPLILVVFSLTTIVPGWKLHYNSWLGTRMLGGWNIFEYVLFFLFGFILFSSPNFLRWNKKIKWFSLGIAIFLSGLAFFLHYEVPPPAFRSNFYTALLAVRSFSCWAWISTILGFAYQYANFSTKTLSFSNQISAPFYFLHQPVMVAIGFYIIQQPLNPLFKFLSILSITFIITILLCRCIKMYAITGWLFGKPKKTEVFKINQVLKQFQLNQLKIKHKAKVSN